MKVGDIGVLQNIDLFKEMNGTIAEILELVPACAIVHITTEHCDEILPSNGYIVKTMYGPTALIEYHQIRPISDPDAEVIKEEELCNT